MRRIRYSTVAHRDLSEAADFYRRRASASVASRFYDDVIASARRALEHSHAGEHRAVGVRRIRCHTFPYYVYYRITASGIEVVGVRHQKRRPFRFDRLR